MTSALPQTYTHPTPLTTLAPHLIPHLPKSLPLLRRLQFHTSSPSALTIATFPPSSAPATPFSALWADRTRAPETEIWIFSTYETLPLLPAPTPSQRQEAKAQCLALLANAARLPAPTPWAVVGSVNEILLRLIGGEEYIDGLVPQGVVEHGHGVRGGDVNVVSGISVPYCKWLIAPPGRNVKSQKEAAGEDEKEDDDYETPLPPNYAFSTLLTHELPLTISRTSIPKTAFTLAQLGNVCVRYVSDATVHSTPSIPSTPPSPPSQSLPTTTTTTPIDPSTSTQPPNQSHHHQPIAWAFLGVDGSLSSLHVEPAHRRQGLAKAVSRRLLRRLADDAAAMGFRAVSEGPGDDWGGVYGGQEGGGGEHGGRDRDGGTGGETTEYGAGEGWAHSDVAEENVGSAGVARGLGGRVGWRVRWVRMELAAAVAVGEGEGEGEGGG